MAQNNNQPISAGTTKKDDGVGSNSVTPLSRIINNLDFIISHFKQPIWPRTISTRATHNSQTLIFDKKEAIRRYQQSGLIDCRINAYGNYTEYKGINRQRPEFLFIDIDRQDFETESKFKEALKATLTNIENILGGHPSVIWTGNGFHIYQPIEALVLEQEDLFSQFDRPSQRFLKYAALRLTNSKCDTQNNPNFRSCMLRVPGTYNGKYFIKNGGIEEPFSEVRIIQKWNGNRPAINPMLYDFFIYLANERMKNLLGLQRNKSYRSILHNEVPWIEKLLRTSISDGRKFAIRRILAPYLINIKQQYTETSYRIIYEWLEKCHSLRCLDCKLNAYASYNLDCAKKIGYKPISKDGLKIENPPMYTLLFA